VHFFGHTVGVAATPSNTQAGCFQSTTGGEEPRGAAMQSVTGKNGRSMVLVAAILAWRPSKQKIFDGSRVMAGHSVRFCTGLSVFAKAWRRLPETRAYVLVVAVDDNANTLLF
jgi:hypothetical protein